MFQRLISEGRRGHADLTAKLTTSDPFSNKSSSWFEPEWMFGVKDGFDILIGNPPYIQLQKLRGNPIQRVYKEQNFHVHDSNGDIYCLFYERGINLLQERGLLAFITSNKWMRAAYGEKLRRFFMRYNSLIIINQATRDKLVAEDPSSTAIIKPILQGRDIERYVYEWRQKWIIATFPALSLSIDQFPAIKKHLLSFGIEKLEQSGKVLKDGSK